MKTPRDHLHWRRRALTLLIAATLALAPTIWATAHDAAALTAVIAQHEADVAAHGHAHEDIDLRQHALDDHWLEVLDTDKPAASLPPPPPGARAGPDDESPASAFNFSADDPVRRFERPPRR